MNLELLTKKIDEIGIPIAVIADKMGLSRQSLYLKLKGLREFKASEMNVISDILRLTNAERSLIFFNVKVGKNANK